MTNAEPTVAPGAYVTSPTVPSTPVTAVITPAKPSSTTSLWTPQYLTYSVLHVGSLLGLFLVVVSGHATWADVKDPFYALVGLGIGIPLSPGIASIVTGTGVSG